MKNWLPHLRVKLHTKIPKPYKPSPRPDLRRAYGESMVVPELQSPASDELRDISKDPLECVRV